MSLLSVLMENEGIQTYISENEEVVMEASQALAQFPQVVKDAIYQSLGSLVVEGDVKATYEKMVVFTESAVMHYMDELTNQMVA